MNRPKPEDIERVTRACRDEPVEWTPVSRGDQTAAWRWVVRLAGGGRAFVKIGWSLDSASWVRDEHLFYARARGFRFCPEMIGWFDDGVRPVLALEDLSGATWPPPWERRSIDAVLAGLDEVSKAPPPDLPLASESQFGINGWRHVLEDPSEFLSLGLCSEGWFETAGPTLMAAAAEADLKGGSLLHFDVRSDNLCIRDGSAVFVDWNFACLGNPLADVAAWLPGLHAEGAPRPRTSSANRRGSVSSRLCSPATSAPGQASPRSPRRHTFADFRGCRRQPPSPGRPGRWLSPRRHRRSSATTRATATLCYYPRNQDG